MRKSAADMGVAYRRVRNAVERSRESRSEANSMMNEKPKYAIPGARVSARKIVILSLAAPGILYQMRKNSSCIAIGVQRQKM